jgi:hypothetical protein
MTLIRMDIELLLNRELNANVRESAATMYAQAKPSDCSNCQGTPPGK